MRRRRAIYTAVVTLFAMALAPLTSYADPNPTPSANATLSPMDQYRVDRDLYNNTIKQRNATIKNINIAFKAALDKAALDFKNAMATSKTPDQKNIAVTQKKNAISAAIIARDNAIAALGAEPLPPVEPMKSAKPMKVFGKNKSR